MYVPCRYISCHDHVPESSGQVPGHCAAQEVTAAQQYHLVGEVDPPPTAGGLLIKPVVKPRRQGWDKRFQQAIAQGQAPEGSCWKSYWMTPLRKRSGSDSDAALEIWLINLDPV